MAPNDPTNEFRELWQGQHSREEQMSVDHVRALAHKMERKIRWRNMREYAAGLLLVILIVPTMWSDTSVLVRIGAGLIAVACVYVMRHLHAWGTARHMPAGVALATSLDFRREELVRQRDLLRNIWSWYLLPFVPGGAFILIGRALERPDRRLFVALAAAVVSVVFVGVAWLNSRAARAVQQEIDELVKVR